MTLTTKIPDDQTTGEFITHVSPEPPELYKVAPRRLLVDGTGRRTILDRFGPYPSHYDVIYPGFGRKR